MFDNNQGTLFRGRPRQWYGGQPIGQAEVEAALKDWGPWKALAYWFWDWTHEETA
jgi:hypothetical protein